MLSKPILEVVVVVVELCSGICGGCETEGDREVLFTDYAEKNVISVGAVLIESY